MSNNASVNRAQRTLKTPANGEAGFTLIELSIVLVVIGLIIGGVLKGQEMIESARVKSTMQQVQAFQAAHMTFKDRYSGVPGDLLNANTLLGTKVGITWANCNGGNARCDGDAVIEGSNNNEALLYWQHLAASGLIAGVEMSASPTTSFGTGQPAAPVGGGFNVWHNTINGQFSQWLLLAERPGGTGGPFDGDQLAQLDKKYDDGHPGQGWIRSANANCITNASGNWPTNTSTYNIAGTNCRVAFEIE